MYLFNLLVNWIIAQFSCTNFITFVLYLSIVRNFVSMTCDQWHIKATRNYDCCNTTCSLHNTRLMLWIWQSRLAAFKFSCSTCNTASDFDCLSVEYAAKYISKSNVDRSNCAEQIHSSRPVWFKIIKCLTRELRIIIRREIKLTWTLALRPVSGHRTNAGGIVCCDSRTVKGYY